MTDNNFDLSKIDKNLYEIVDLPSKGRCYPKSSPIRRCGGIAVYYLTADDENLIYSSHLIENNGIFDALLNKKIVDKNINPDDLCAADKEAIILWLRRTGYGNDFPVYGKDFDGTEFTSVVDLSTIEYEELTLEGDDDGLFTHKLPNGDIIKYTYIAKNINKDVEIPITDYLKQIIKSVNNNTNKNYIYDYIDNMTAEELFNIKIWYQYTEPKIRHKVNINTNEEIKEMDIHFSADMFLNKLIDE